MTNEGTSSTLVLIGAILQLIFVFIYIGLAAIFGFGLSVIWMIPPSYLPPGITLEYMMFFATVLTGYFAVGSILSILFTILWLMWRSQPSQHKVGLIITGILGLPFAGFFPGLFTIFGGITAKKPEEVAPVAPEAAKAAPEEGVQYCSSCGSPIADPTSQFCGTCGASVT